MIFRVFKKCVVELPEHWPGDGKPDLLREWEFLYERSMGCVGVLKDWLMRVAVTSLKKASGAVKLFHLEQTALSISQCEKILAEAREGEARLTETDQSVRHFRSLLGLHAVSQAEPAPEKDLLSPCPKRKSRHGYHSAIRLADHGCRPCVAPIPPTLVIIQRPVE